ncbi:MAG TPA: hypothetical protein VOA41_17815 [Candidatus Dormibacteraeota bacterium]|nr:hypothetical protein [Candidatus Dormibacteraeota bacterium]
MTKPLEITRRLLGSSAIVYKEPGARDIGVELDVEGFIRRLLLFDSYILYSVRLKEIGELVRHFGYEGTLMLLSSGALEIRCECAQFVEGQFSTPACPPLTFQFHVIDAHDRNQYLIDNLSEVSRAPALNSRQLMELQAAVTRAVRQPDYREMFSSTVAPAFENDILHNTPLIKAAVRFVLAKAKGITIVDDFVLRFHKVADDRYETETDLLQKLTFGIEDTHNLLKAAVLGISGVDQRLGEMKAHTALSGFTDEELPLFRSKLDSLAEADSSQGSERRFRRVVAVAGLPEISGGSRINIEKVLKIRSQPEALEFRAWSADIDRLSDSEIQERISSFNVKLGLAAQTGTGKVLRFLMTTVAGIVPPLGIALSALDQFAWDKFARRSGIAGFIHELYPSIFAAPQAR